MGELHGDDPTLASETFTAPGRLHATYNFNLLEWGGLDVDILSGVGMVQLRGQAAQKIIAGDTVWIEPGEEHWHGAMPAHAMIHIAIQESLDGTMANWLNKLSDEEYQQSVATL